MRKYISLLVAAVLATSMSCEVLDMDVQDDPNALKTDQYNLNAYLNSIQIDLANFLAGSENIYTGYEGASELGMEVTRMTTMFGPLYSNAYDPTTFDFLWETAYADLLKDSDEIIRIAEEEEFYRHAAIAKIIQSYVLVTLVDFFGDIPYTESMQGVANLNPGLTSGQEVYAEALRLLNESIEDLGRQGFGNPEDLYYGGVNVPFQRDKWIALANSLKLRIYVQTKHINPGAGAAISEILSTGNIIDTKEEDFQFRYSTNLSAPDSRHPQFSTSYDNGADDYMSNSLMNRLYVGRPLAGGQNVRDPRIRFYFYRQNTGTSAQTVQSLPCVGQEAPPHYAGFIFCRVPTGYWGRDHGNNDGLPPDDLSRTIWGLYPFGGEFDANQSLRGFNTSGAQGSGIQPILLSSYVYFLRAEAALTMGTGEDPRALLEQGLIASLDKVLNFDLEIGFTGIDPNFYPTQEAVENYIAATLEAYDDASAEGQLEVVMEEFYVALFGNGVDAFNAYRRTGYPNDLQPTLEPNPGGYIYSFQYPSNLVNRNSAVSQKPVDNSVRVFWDPGLTLN